MDYGIITLLPIVVVIAVALKTKRTLEPLIIGTILTYIIVDGSSFAQGWMDAFFRVATNRDHQWVFMVCALFGSLITLLGASHGALGFSRWLEKLCRGPKTTLIVTWVMGILIFVDDYLNCLAVGAAVRPLSDEYKISREMLSYIINSTGVVVCAIVPISTWGAFMGGLMGSSGLDGGLSVFSAYTHAIPYMFYCIIAVVTVPLVAFGILPMFKPMKAAETRAVETGEVLSPESRAMLVEGLEDEKKLESKKCRAFNFIVPILSVAVFTIWLDDMVMALFISIVICFALYLPQRLMNVKGFVDTVVKGLTDMFSVMVLIILTYMLIDVNDMLGLNDLVVDLCRTSVNPKLIPFIIFVGIGLLSFASGSFWGLAGIAFPIVGPVCESLGLNPFLLSGALISAIAFGGHICMYSDTVILTSASTQASNTDYFKTSFPIIMAYPFAIGAILYLIAGFLMC